MEKPNVVAWLVLFVLLVVLFHQVTSTGGGTLRRTSLGSMQEAVFGAESSHVRKMNSSSDHQGRDASGGEEKRPPATMGKISSSQLQGKRRSKEDTEKDDSEEEHTNSARSGHRESEASFPTQSLMESRRKGGRRQPALGAIHNKLLDEVPALDPPLGFCLARDVELRHPDEDGFSNKSVQGKDGTAGWPSSWPEGKVTPHKEGHEYSADTCRIAREVKCNSAPGKKKGRALFIMMMHLWAQEGRTESTNFAHFLKYGLLSPETSTELYDGADYVFARLTDQVTQATICMEHQNIKLVHVPVVPCDLCAHRLVLDLLGWKSSNRVDDDANAANNQQWPWKTVVFMNSGVRGPIFAPEGPSHWLDVIGMAGTTKRPVHFDAQEMHFKTVGGAAFSWEGNFHLQSYFLVVPFSAINYYYHSFHNACTGRGKDACIVKVELRTVMGLFSHGNRGWQVYSYTQGVTADKNTNFRELGSRFGPTNPTYMYTDACKAVFGKFGGGAWFYIPLTSRRGRLQVSRQMSALNENSKAARAKSGISVIRELLAKLEPGKCNWFREPKVLSDKMSRVERETPPPFGHHPGAPGFRAPAPGRSNLVLPRVPRGR